MLKNLLKAAVVITALSPCLLSAAWASDPADWSSAPEIVRVNAQIKANPKDALLFVHRAEVSYDLGYQKKAISDLLAALDLSSTVSNENSFHKICARLGTEGQAIAKLAATDLELIRTPNDGPLLIERGDLKWSLGQLSDAIDDYSKAIQSEPDNPQGYLCRVDAYFREGNNQAAYDDLSKLVEMSGNNKIKNSTLYMRRSIALEGMGKFSEAEKDFSKAIDLYPIIAALPSQHLYLAEKYAIEDLSKVIENHPNDAAAYINRADLYASGLTDGGKTFSTYKDFVPLASESWPANWYQRMVFRYSKAAEDYSKAIAINPSDAASIYKRALAYHACGELEKSQSDFATVAKLVPALNLRPTATAGRQGAPVSTVDLYLKASQDFSQVLKLQPDNLQALTNRAVARGTIGLTQGILTELKPAIEDISTVLKAKPNSQSALFNRNLLYVANNPVDNTSYEKAISDASLITQYAPGDASAWCLLAQELAANHKPDEARAAYAQAIKVDPDVDYKIDATLVGRGPTVQHTPMLMRQALEVFRHKMIDEYSDKLAKTPDDQEALKHRALLYVAVSERQKAIADYSAIIELDPSASSAYAARADLLAQNSDTRDQALFDFNKALTLNPKFISARIARARLYQNQSRYQDACDDFSKAIAQIGDKVAFHQFGNRASGEAVLYFNRSQVLELLGKHEESLKDLVQCKKLSLDLIGDYKLNGLNQAATAIQNGEFDKAIDALTNELKSNPENAAALTNRGIAYILRAQGPQ